MSVDPEKNGIFGTSSKSPPHRSFQENMIHTYAEKRRRNFLDKRKQRRKDLLGRMREIAKASNAQNSDDDNVSINDGSTRDSSVDTENNPLQPVTIPMECDEKDNNNTMDSMDTTPSKHRKRRNKRRNKNDDSNSERSSVDYHKMRNRAMAKTEKKRLRCAQEFMIHDWLVDIPSDFYKNWYLAVRPEGERCLVISSLGRTISRARSGNIKHRFPSLLPGGNRKQSQTFSHICVLDCIFSEVNRTYYVIDILSWGSHPVYDCDAAMRIWWIQSKISEVDGIGTHSKYNRYRFESLHFEEKVTIESLKKAYQFAQESQSLPVKKPKSRKNKKHGHSEMIIDDGDSTAVLPAPRSDGLLFYHKQGRYEPSMSTPLVLCWKDANSSPWFVDTAEENCTTQPINLKLQAAPAYTLTTYEEQEVVLGVVNAADVKRQQLRAGSILKFSISDANLNQCSVKDLTFIRKCSPSKLLADTWSKIVFQSNARQRRSIQFDQLLDAVTPLSTVIPTTEEEWAMEEDNVDELLKLATLGLR